LSRDRLPVRTCRIGQTLRQSPQCVGAHFSNTWAAVHLLRVGSAPSRDLQQDPGDSLVLRYSSRSPRGRFFYRWGYIRPVNDVCSKREPPLSACRAFTDAEGCLVRYILIAVVELLLDRLNLISAGYRLCSSDCANNEKSEKGSRRSCPPHPAAVVNFSGLHLNPPFFASVRSPCSSYSMVLGSVPTLHPPEYWRTKGGIDGSCLDTAEAVARESRRSYHHPEPSQRHATNGSYFICTFKRSTRHVTI